EIGRAQGGERLQEVGQARRILSEKFVANCGQVFADADFQGRRGADATVLEIMDGELFELGFALTLRYFSTLVTGSPVSAGSVRSTLCVGGVPASGFLYQPFQYQF